jgi:hypothetical protein
MKTDDSRERYPTPTFFNPSQSVLGATSDRRAAAHVLAGPWRQDSWRSSPTPASRRHGTSLPLWVLLPMVRHHKEPPMFLLGDHV